MCEKSLVPDAILCVNSTNVGSSIIVNSSTTLSIGARFTAAICIQYCRGLDQGYAYVVVAVSSCTCATNITFDASVPPSTSNVSLPITSCDRSASLSLIGKATGSSKFTKPSKSLEQNFYLYVLKAVAIYNTNLSAIHFNPKLGSSTCKSYDAELYITRFGIDSLLLQSDIGKPTLKASCGYLNRRLD